ARTRRHRDADHDGKIVAHQRGRSANPDAQAIAVAGYRPGKRGVPFGQAFEMARELRVAFPATGGKHHAAAPPELPSATGARADNLPVLDNEAADRGFQLRFDAPLQQGFHQASNQSRPAGAYSGPLPLLDEGGIAVLTIDHAAPSYKFADGGAVRIDF